MTGQADGAGFPEQVRVRLAKADRLRAAGRDPYPVGRDRTATAAELRARFAGLSADTGTGQQAAVAGRVLLRRDAGRLCFATVRDPTGDLQLMFDEEHTGTARLSDWKSDVDLGDQVWASGEVVTSRRGELSVLADRWELVAKALRPLPEKFHGLTDPEARVRQRYLDLVVNPEARRLLLLRASAVRSLRDSLHRRGFVEVETPVLQPVHGGANARPFVTHINAYNMRLYLRIAHELYLKRLVVGGVEKVFELGRVFRNEGVDTTHNPDFTMLELYQAYTDYRGMAELTRDLVLEAAQAALGGTVLRRPDRAEHDLRDRWPVLTVHDAVSSALGEQVTPDTDLARLRSLAEAADVPYRMDWTAGQVLLELYERLVEARTGPPTFYLDFPVEVSPLTRAHRVDPRLAERWDLVAFGTELATAYTELNDPVEQRRRLTEQSLRAAGGDPEAMALDEEFLLALEHGMPPTGGMGMGVERLLQAFTGAGIRETILFPLVRPD